MIDDVRSLLGRILVATLLLVGLDAAPAAADPAGPSDFRSEVTGISPDVEGVDAEIRGGDAFLELTVKPGREVVVYGYEPGRAKPYLRFREDGTVERNRNATATYINDDRRGGGEIPPEAQDPDAEPVWEEVADGGRYAWHDHRVHWMAEVDPPVDRGERVGGDYDPWLVPIDVDGRPAEIEGTLVYEEAASPLPWIAVGLGAAAALAWVGRRHPVRSSAAALVVVATLAVVVGRADYSSTPDAGGNALLWILPAAALALAAVALVRHRTGSTVVLALASVAGLSGWALLRIEVLLKPVLPTDLSPSLDRASVAAALGVAAAAAYLAISSGALRLPELEDD